MMSTTRPDFAPRPNRQAIMPGAPDIGIPARAGAGIPHLSEHLVRRLRATTNLGPSDIEAIERLPVIVKKFAGQTPIAREGDRMSQCGLLIKGFACRCKTIDSG